jgi:hypothetical protein
MRASAADGEGERGCEQDGEYWRLRRRPTAAGMEPTTAPVMVTARWGRVGSVLVPVRRERRSASTREP